MTGKKPNPGTPKDKRLKGRGAKPGPKKGSHNKGVAAPRVAPTPG